MISLQAAVAARRERSREWRSLPSRLRQQRVQEFIAAFQALRSEVRKVIVGHDEVITHVLIGLFAGGHVLLEGVPGLGKTLLIKTLAESLDLTFSRIQFTPDLMPGDIIGTNMIVEDEAGAEALPVPARAHLRQHPARRRGEPRDAEDAVGAARGDAGGQRSPCRGTRNPLPAALLRARHAEPDRDGGHLSRCPRRSSTASSSSCGCSTRRSRS